MNKRTLLILALISAACGLTAIMAGGSEVKMPGNHQGYQPKQPIAFSHALHAGELELECLYCHSAADEGRHATVPSVETCMTCHESVEGSTDQARAEIGKVREAFSKNEAIRWEKVHRYPDLAYFNHSAHVAKDLACETCHGDVKNMRVMKQESDLSMGWCVNCHREQNELREDVNAPLDCAACHR